MCESTQNQTHILAINDDPAILGLFHDLLTEEGYRVSLNIFASSTVEILAQIRMLQPDLIIMDYIVGREGTGWQALQAVRMDRATRHIPVIICTAARRQVEDLGQHLSDMRVHTVFKPFDIDHLLQVVETILNEPNATDMHIDPSAHIENINQDPDPERVPVAQVPR